MKTYSEKLKDPKWQQKRLRILERDGFECRQCQRSDEELHVHHIQYNKDPWEVKDQFLITLCKTCHGFIEDKKKDFKNDLDYLCSINPEYYFTVCQIVSDIITYEVPVNEVMCLQSIASSGCISILHKTYRGIQDKCLES